MTSRFTIPIYGASVLLVVSDEPYAEIAKLNKKFTTLDDKDFEGSVVGEKGVYAICFKRANLSHGLIAHEVKHLVRSIQEWLGLQISRKTEEYECLLEGWLTDKIYMLLKKDKSLSTLDSK